MRRPKSFWEARIAELSRGRSIESVARQHGVTSGLVRWWRWRLRSESTAAISPARMIEILPAPTPALAAMNSLRVLVGDVVLELPAGTPPEYVGRVLGATRPAC